MLATVIGALWYWQPQPQAPVTQNAPLNPPGEVKKSTKAPNEAKRALERRLASEQNRLDQLQSSLEDVNFLQSSVDAIKSHVQGVTAQIQAVQDRRKALEASGGIIDRGERGYVLRQRLQRNSLMADMEVQIQSINNSILNLQNQIRQARSVAAVPDQDLELQISQLQVQRSQLRSQIRILAIQADNDSILANQEAQNEKDLAQNERRDLDREINDLNADVEYWKKQQAAAGDEFVRQKRVQELQGQIDDQKKVVTQLQQEILKLY